MSNFSSLNDLNSLNNLSGLISSKKLLTLIFPSTLAPKHLFCSDNVGWIIKKSIFS
jgi:hypothetical protein